MSELTSRQQLLLNFMGSFLVSRGYPPTIREMMSAMDTESPNGVMCHLKALKRKGYVDWSKSPRSYRLTHPIPLTTAPEVDGRVVRIGAFSIELTPEQACMLGTGLLHPVED
jgi:SOS-response transcriptional repressor LexA